METKRCVRCHVEKPVTEFNRHSARRLQNHCRACNREYLKQHYRLNKPYYVEKARRFKRQRKRAAMKELLAYFGSHPCVDCGETDPVVLQFDHVRGVKSAAVGTMFAEGKSWETISAEIEKCDVRCANCHWRKTAAQFGWYSYMLEELEERNGQQVLALEDRTRRRAVPRRVSSDHGGG